MSDIAIRVEHLSKLYTSGARQERHDTLRDAIADYRLKIKDSLRPRHLQSSIFESSILCKPLGAARRLFRGGAKGFRDQLTPERTDGRMAMLESSLRE